MSGCRLCGYPLRTGDVYCSRDCFHRYRELVKEIENDGREYVDYWKGSDDWMAKRDVYHLLLTRRHMSAEGTECGYATGYRKKDCKPIAEEDDDLDDNELWRNGVLVPEWG